MASNLAAKAVRGPIIGMVVSHKVADVVRRRRPSQQRHYNQQVRIGRLKDA